MGFSKGKGWNPMVVEKVMLTYSPPIWVDFFFWYFFSQIYGIFALPQCKMGLEDIQQLGRALVRDH